MYGYPEQFIPAPELVGAGSPRAAAAAVSAASAGGLTPSEVPA